jgi:hypothetical protein
MLDNIRHPPGISKQAALSDEITSKHCTNVPELGRGCTELDLEVA